MSRADKDGEESQNKLEMLSKRRKCGCIFTDEWMNEWNGWDVYRLAGGAFNHDHVSLR
jgi:hypothetical protein